MNKNQRRTMMAAEMRRLICVPLFCQCSPILWNGPTLQLSLLNVVPKLVRRGSHRAMTRLHHSRP